MSYFSFWICSLYYQGVPAGILVPVQLLNRVITLLLDTDWWKRPYFIKCVELLYKNSKLHFWGGVVGKINTIKFRIYQFPLNGPTSNPYPSNFGVAHLLRSKPHSTTKISQPPPQDQDQDRGQLLRRSIYFVWKSKLFGI